MKGISCRGSVRLTEGGTRERLKDVRSYTIDPSVCHGKPCIRGLRYPVENVLEWLASGMSIEEILADYEDLEREDILAVLSYDHSVVRT